MTTQTQTEVTASTATSEAKPLGELSFPEFEARRLAERAAAKEGVKVDTESKSAPAEKAEQKESEASDTTETEEEESKDESEDQDESESEDESEKAKPKKKGGFQRKIDKLTARERAANERAERLEAELAALKGAAAVKKPDQVETAKAADGKPDPNKFESYDEYVEKLTEWKLEQKEAKERQAKLESEHKSKLQTHHDRERAFAEKTDDYKELLADVNYLKGIPGGASEVIVTSEIGPEIMYELAKNPKELERIKTLSDAAAAAAIGKIEARLSKPAEVKPEPKKITSAPKPPTPVGTGRGTVAKSLEDAAKSGDFASYERIRREQLKAKRA